MSIEGTFESLKNIFIENFLYIKNVFAENYFYILSGVFSSFLLLSLGAYLFKLFCSYRLRRKLKKRFDHARRGEKSAEDLLIEEGYFIEGLQKTSKLAMWINGKQFSYAVRPDAFASKEGKKYLVEIKTGKLANDPKHSATRRQLLEYFHGFSVDGVLLVDAEMGEIHNIHFEHKSVRNEYLDLKKDPIKMKLFSAFSFGALTALLIIYLHAKGRA